jgi:hypothetical protein
MSASKETLLAQEMQHWVPHTLSLEVKWAKRAADNSLLISAKVKKCGSIHPLPHTPLWRSAKLVKHRYNFTLFFFLVKCDVLSYGGNN